MAGHNARPPPDRPEEFGFWQATLDALGDSTAVLDGKGEIVAVNAAWRAFAQDGGGVDVGIGANYLSVCDRSARTDSTAAPVAGALRELLAGRRAEFEWAYPCHGPGRQRWFSMRAAPMEGVAVGRFLVGHHEITGRQQAEDLSHEQAGLLSAVDAAMVAVDLNGVITQWSAGAELLHGWSADEALGQPMATLDDSDHEGRLAAFAATLADGAWDGNLEVGRRDGSRFIAYVRSRLITDASGAPTGLVCVYVDTTELMAMEHDLRSARDFLAAVMRAMPDGLIVLDSDGRITLVNEVAEQMLGWTATELLGRGEHETLHALRADGSPTPVADCPITQGRERDRTVRLDDDVFERRDGSLMPVRIAAAPLRTEMGNPGSVLVFGDITESKSRELRARRELEALSWVGRIRDALDEDRLVLYAQPIVDIASGRTVQHELLVRMVGHHGEVITPERFLPVAEEHGLIEAIDRRVLELAMPYAAAGHRIGINLSAGSLSAAGTFRFVRELLARYEVDGGSVVFEVTETALMNDEDIAQAFIENVRSLGCGVALDDFGSGFGGFRYLKRMPVNYLKIDKEFILDAGSVVNRQVIQAIVTLARGMGQLTIAEGVETSAALGVVRELGVDCAQGYLFARPAPACDVFQAIPHQPRLAIAEEARIRA